MELEDYLYQAENALSDDKAGVTARYQHPNKEELLKLIGLARCAIREIFFWLEKNTPRRCP